MFTPLITDTRKKIRRATSILFLVQLFGALGAGAFFTVQQILGKEHLLGALEPANEKILWFLLFWGTDFFGVALAATLCTLLAGPVGLAPGLALGVYFAHFAGNAVVAEDVYFTYFATPFQNGGGVNIGYLGYFVMALCCGLLIKLLNMGYTRLKHILAQKIDNASRKKSGGLAFMGNFDLIVYVLTIPVVSAALTFLLMRYGVQKPTAWLDAVLPQALVSLSSAHIWIVGILFGLLAGFDITGPFSMVAFAAAATTALQGDLRLLTIYGAVLAATGWSPLFMTILSAVTKKIKTDGDDLNLGISGPINALFDNLRLTVTFSATYALRAPFAVIPGLMAGSALTGLLTAVFGIVNISYLDRVRDGLPMRQLLERGDLYLALTLPLRSGGWLACRLPLALFVLLGGVCGGTVMFFLRKAQINGQKHRGTYVEPTGDIVRTVSSGA
jgi:hypothetical protein